MFVFDGWEMKEFHVNKLGKLTLACNEPGLDISFLTTLDFQYYQLSQNRICLWGGSVITKHDAPDWVSAGIFNGWNLIHCDPDRRSLKIQQIAQNIIASWIQEIIKLIFLHVYKIIMFRVLWFHHQINF